MVTACVHAQAQHADAISAAEQGQVDLPSEVIGELSGITYFGDDLFAVVSDKGGKLGMATIAIDRETGEITSAKIDETIDLVGGRDIEDVAIDPTTCMLLTVDEADQSLALHHFPTGQRMQAIAVPGVFQEARANLGFESVSASLYTGSIWAANEEALKVDGPRATKNQGALIRLQRFNSAIRPVEQYAYRVDPHRGSDNIIERAQSGVSGLVALPNGELIVMERELGGAVLPSFRIRLYLVDTTDATKTSEFDALTADGITPVRKQLLFEINAGPTNFEGIALGPRLDDGDYALILVSDDGARLNPQRLLALRIAGDLVEASSDDSSRSVGE